MGPRQILHHSKPEPHKSRQSITKPQRTMEMHCEGEHADKHKVEVGPIPPSDYQTFRLKRQEQGWTRQGVVRLVSLTQRGQTLRDNLAKLGAQPQRC